ncbi:hypothetical protein LVD15_02760 [Fulvivirga maritima]|uniref:hypothetical protein n=1 Tax=Fulvivirga maritima TaxID=2904247 RepID=UPI001F467A66|nr:hypothetical protein [Fulvivirga maritima]UII27369.1 hypothetical protein LVD15_02760 [Fulvivirga maritima]
MRSINFLIFVFLLLNIAPVFSQNFDIQESEPLKEEPVVGWLKIFQLSDGKTALLHITERDGFHVWVYSKERKLLVDKFAKPQFNSKGRLELRTTEILSAFDQGDELVTFLSIEEKKQPTSLYRVIIDTNDGKLKSEELVAKLQPNSKKVKNKFLVRHDDKSGNYAIGLYNATEFSKNKQVQLVFYDANHTKMTEAYFIPTSGEYKALRLVEFMVLDNQVIALVGSDLEKNKGTVFIGSLKSDHDFFYVKEKDFNGDQKLAEAVLKYNPQEKFIVALSLLTYAPDLNSVYGLYSSNLTVFDPESLSTKYVKDLDNPSVEVNYESFANTDHKYEGVPSDFHVNSDGTYSVIYERRFYRLKGSVVLASLLGDAVVSTFSPELRLQKETLVPKSHSLQGDISVLIHNDVRNEATKLLGSNQYKFLSYVNGAESNYLLYNDVFSNGEKIKESGKLALISGVSATDAFYVDINKAANNYDRTALFGKKAESRDYQFGMFSVADYDQESHTYATLRLNAHDGKTIQVIWVKI